MERRIDKRHQDMSNETWYATISKTSIMPIICK